MSKTLKQLIKDERLVPEGPEMEAIRQTRSDMESMIRGKFGIRGLTFKYGGSKAKGTILKCEHDLDLLAYFDNDNKIAGNTLEEIYNSMWALLNQPYDVVPGTTSLRLYQQGARRDLKVDLVPGRYTESDDGTVYLHQNGGEVNWLKTNPDMHIEHVTESGVVEALCGLKTWRVRNGVKSMRQFPFELLCIDLLQPLKRKTIEEQVSGVLEGIASTDTPPRVEDPANKDNDVSKRLKEGWGDLRSAAQSSLGRANQGWASVLGIPPEPANVDTLHAMARSVSVQTKPWAN